MSGGIEEPYAIAALAKPLDGKHGRIVGASVHSIAGSRKRKRHEVAIGVDGESVSIYHTQDQSTVSSYALPPQSYLAAPPCSIYCKRAKPQQPQRQTYLAVWDSVSRQKARVVSIKENLGKPQSDEREPRAPTRRERKLRHAQVVAIDVVPVHNTLASLESDQHPVLVSYSNGDVDCLRGDMSAARWEHKATTTGDTQIEYAVVVEYDAARRGLLKNREDVLAVLDSSADAGRTTNGPPLLCQVIRTGSQRSLRIFALRNLSGDTLQGGRSSFEDVLTYDLPARHNTGTEEAQYELHAASAMLYQRLGNRLTTYDVSGTTPEASFELGRRDGLIVNSFTRLSSATVLVVTPDKLAVYDTKYGSVLSSLAYVTQPDAAANAQARSSLAIISQFTDLNILVALSANNLIAFQVGNMLDDGRSSRAQEPVLFDVLGKGKVALLEGSELKEKKKRKWEEWKSKVDGLFEASNAEGLESFVAKMLKLDPKTQDKAAENLPSGYHDADVALWDLPSNTYDPQHVETRRASYLLRKLFAWRSLDRRSHSAGNLEITLLSRNVLRFLALAGYLTTSTMQLVLPQANDGTKRRVAPGDIMLAIADGEPSLVLMCDLISMRVHWDLPEIVQGLQTLIRSLQDKQNADMAAAQLTNGVVDMADGDVQTELDAVERELDKAENLLESGLAIRAHACRILLNRLQAFPQRDVKQVMHTMLTHADLIFFLCLLRLELADGGWTQRYLEQDVGEEEPSLDVPNAQDITASNLAIRTIADLFDCAVDAIGLSGWLIGLSADIDGTEQLLQELKNEVSATVEGLFEAELLTNLLSNVKKTAAVLGEQQRSTLKRKLQTDEDDSVEDKLMPVGGRPEPPIVRTWGTKDGRKSKAAIAQQKSRAVGKYSFEQIRI
ncbi:hypothetical protein CLAFUW4_03617 [Fulvia fulva]|uniref:Utp8 beta-propeller domain-containing protein n=1 Tax=Passalora fulva TaxID=5499 RepID=A0A9Q8LBZ7_PASFU|nr:uncharacterized protein CLAFUR5_03596 [Fulvia fulva]KAK4633327.1 hypothetical protein CLAFUR0_03608 [Fulvia fulva]UJO14454.1 hypothetical protein CLAFUR5_03596 [Fulvia fulva]WPV11586.1 hypothetical protein CLAFUW4_03617 [Fulvia fulva]WPV25809.1 hypothetical protein CLAFUW7_03609 [Fulvia fulva]